MSELVVEVSNLSRSFGKTKALECVDFQSEPWQGVWAGRR